MKDSCLIFYQLTRFLSELTGTIFLFTGVVAHCFYFTKNSVFAVQVLDWIGFGLDDDGKRFSFFLIFFVHLLSIPISL